MSNFITEFNKGQAGENKGLEMGKGLANFSRHVNGVQRSRFYAIASPPKVGKSTFVDNGFLIKPYLYALKNKLNVKWDYYSYEIDRVSKEFDVAAHFLYYDYKISSVILPDGVTYENQNVVPISSNYLRGRLVDDNGNMIKISKDIGEKLKDVYFNRIIPIFGKYSDKGVLQEEGAVNFIEEKNNPTGIFYELMDRAREEGTFHSIPAGKDKEGKEKSRIVGYTPNDPTLHRIVIIDHLRKLKLERGWLMKATVDKMSEYIVDMRNWLGYTFIGIIHTNRSLGSTDNLKFFKGNIFPTSDSIKDTGNLSEDADYVITLMNPNDDKYNLEEHFGLSLKNEFGYEKYPNLRTIHLVESRHCDFPKHFKVDMLGNVKEFELIN